uniref:plectin-like n=1 Tax=Pristiophorus japonicus TaxID=55135 RepID=UPI00398EA81A
MAKLELSKSHGELGKTFQDKGSVPFGNERLKDNSRHLETVQEDLEPSESVQDALASRSAQGEWYKPEGDFVGARLSRMSISSSTEVFSHSASVKLHSETSEKPPVPADRNDNATFPAQVGNKYHTSSSQNILSKAQDGNFPSTETLEFQGLRHQVTVQELVEAELLNRNVAGQLAKGIQTVSQVQKSLGKYLNKVNSIAGLYLESSKQKMSFYQAAKEGIIGTSVALEFLEAQAATGYIVNTLSNEKYSVQEAIEKGIVAPEFKERLLQAEKGVTGYFHYGKALSVFQAMESKLLARQTGGRLLEVQIATGGIIDPVRSVRLPLETACKQGLLSYNTVQNLYKVLGNVKGFQNPNKTGQALHYAELMRLCVVDLEGNYLLLPFGSRKISTPSPARVNTISVVDTSTKSEITLYDAFLKYYIEKQTYLELSALQSQWRETIDESQGFAQYFLTDSNSGRQFSIEDALTQGNISQTDLNKYRDGCITVTEFADMLMSRTAVAPDPNSPIAGVWDPNGCRRISVLEAMRQNLVERLTATRLLEAQACTGGITDPATGKKFSISEALQKDLIDTEIAANIQKSQQAYRGFLQPGTRATLSTAEALRRNLLGRDLGHRFLELQYLTGGLVDPHLNARISLEDALRKGLIEEQTAQRLRDEKMHTRNLVCPTTKEKISYKEALARAVFDCHTGLRFLEAAEQPNALN